MTRTALITGANRGLGLETARQLGRSGVKPIIGARDAAKGDRAAAELRDEGIDADSVELDVDSAASVQAAAKQIREQHGLLDILINNAGILPEASAETAGPRESDAGRIVNVSSTMGSLADQSDPNSPYYQLVVPAYQTSKLALNGITVTLAKLLKDRPIKVNSICPGSVQTDLAPGNREAAPLTPEEGAQVVVEMATIANDGPTGQFVDRDGTVAW